MTQPPDEEYIAKLVDEALKHANHYDRVKHIISDESLNPEQRAEALEVLKLRLDQQQRGLG